MAYKITEKIHVIFHIEEQYIKILNCSLHFDLMTDLLKDGQVLPGSSKKTQVPLEEGQVPSGSSRINSCST